MLQPLETRIALSASPSLPVANIANARASEGAGAITFLVSLNKSVNQDVSFAFSTSEVPRSAVAGADFTSVSSTLTLPAGTTTASITVPLIDDSITEKTETFRLVFSSPAGVKLRQRFAVGTITDDDPFQGYAPSLLVGRTLDAVIASGSGVFARRGTFSLTIDSASNYSLIGGPNVPDSSGFFEYARTGLNTARFEAVDELLGGTIKGKLTFTSATIVKYTWNIGRSSQSGVMTLT